MKISNGLFFLVLPFMAYSKRLFDIEGFKIDGDSELLKREDEEQQVLRPLFAEPKAGEILLPDGEQPQDGPTLLTSSISTNKQISVFASYVRDNLEISQKFNSKKTQSIVFAPTDLAIEQLALKPWQFPTLLNNDDSRSEKEIDEIIIANTNDYILSHVVDGAVPFNVLEKNQKGVQLVTLNGHSVKLVNDDSDYYVAATVAPGSTEDWIKVESVSNVDNGVLLVIGKSLSVPSI